MNFRSVAASDPVALHFLEGVAPVDLLQAAQEALGVGGDAQHPLAHRPARDRETAHFAPALDDLFVGQDGAQFLAPPDGGLGYVSQALAVAMLAERVRRAGAFGRAGEGLNRLGFAGGGIEPGIVELEKNPLRPFKIAGGGGVDLAAPIVAETEGFNLPLENGDVGLRRFARMLAGADGVLLGGQAEGVPAHGVEDVATAGALVTGEDVGGGVALRMADVQPGAGRVGEHVEYVELAGQALLRDFACQAVAPREGMPFGQSVARIPGAENLPSLPVALPLRFDEMKRILSPHTVTGDIAERRRAEQGV